MKVFAVSNMVAPSVAQTTYRATWVYHDLFHGGCQPVANRYGEMPYRPVQLRRNVRFIPPVFFPSVFMVAGQVIAKQLASYPHVQLNPCIWDAIYDYPVSEESVRSLLNQLSPIDEGHGNWAADRLKPVTTEDLPSYQEVVVPRHEKVRRTFPPTMSVNLPSPFEDLAPVPTSMELHRQFPIIAVETHYLFNEDAYQWVEPHVRDTSVFSVISFDVT